MTHFEGFFDLFSIVMCSMPSDVSFESHFRLKKVSSLLLTLPHLHQQHLQNWQHQIWGKNLRLNNLTQNVISATMTTAEGHLTHLEK